MSKIKEFENIPDIDIEGEETLEEAVADCKALFGKYNKELFNGEVSLERCSEARLVLLTLAHRSHHNMEYSTACLKAELLPTSTGPNLDNLAPLVGVERMDYLHGQTMRAILEDDPEYFYEGRFTVNAWKSEKPRRLFDSRCLRREPVQRESRKEHR